MPLRSVATPFHHLDRVTLGERLRAARKSFGWTLQQVANSAGISVPTISRAERGQLALSYEKFSALARALNLDLASLFSESSALVRPLERPVVTRAHEGVVYRGSALTYEFLTTQATGKQMTPMRGTVHARKLNGPEDFARHQGEEFVFILRGKVDVHFEDGQVVRLSQGDALYFDSNVGHAYICISREPAKLVGACTSESSFMKMAREGLGLKRQSKSASVARSSRPER